MGHSEPANAFAIQPVASGLSPVTSGRGPESLAIIALLPENENRLLNRKLPGTPLLSNAGISKPKAAVEPREEAQYAVPDRERRLRLWVRAFIYVYAFSYFSLLAADPDLWGHIRFGEDIVQQGAIHETNTYAYTASDYRWINHEWLTEVVFYAIYHLAGSPGLLAVKILLGLYIIHLLSGLHFARSRNVTVYLVLFLLAVPAMSNGFMTRPHLLTFLFLTWMMVALQKFFDGNHRVIRWLPLIFLAWANSHGGVVAGLGVFGLIAFIEGALCWRTGERRGRTTSGGNGVDLERAERSASAPKASARSPRAWRGRLLIGYFALSCGAVLLNPYGYQLWLFFYESLGRERLITEWLPVPLLSLDALPYKILAGLFVLSWFLPTRKRAWEVAVLAVAVVYGFEHQRHTVLTTILLLPYLAAQGSAVSGRLDIRLLYLRLSQGFRRTVQAVLLVFMAFFIVPRVQVMAENNFKIWVEPSLYPTYAARFMQANQLAGNTVVPFDWGEYWIWKFPGSKVSIDGRFRTAYPERIIHLNRAFAEGRPEGRALLTDFPTGFVLAGKHEAAFHVMEQQPGWVKIYQDPLSKIFVRETDPPQPALRKFRNGELIDPDAPATYEFPG